MTIDEYVHDLGEATGHGWGFLAAYGLTWLVCGLLWSKLPARSAAYVTLGQGVVALPVALALTEVASDAPRPEMDGMDGLSILLSVGQLVALPLVIHLAAIQRYTLVPHAMVIVTAVHFAPYAWLYGTPFYLIIGGVISVGAVVAADSGRRTAPGDGSPTGEIPTTAAARVCMATGTVLVLGAVVAMSL